MHFVEISLKLLCLLSMTNQYNKFGSGHVPREVEIKKLAIALRQADHAFHLQNGASTEHQMLARLVSVAKEPDLSIIRNSCKAYLAGANEFDRPNILQFLLPLIFRPDEKNPDATGVHWRWWPLAVNGSKLHLAGYNDAVTSYPGFFFSFDYRRDHSAARTDLSGLKY